MSTTLRRSRKQEENLAKGLGGRTTPRSGAGWAVKNDVKTDDLSIEVKYTDKKSYSLKHTDLKKAERHALADSGRDFAFVVGFGKQSGHGQMVIEDEYVLVSRSYFESLHNGHPV